MVQLVSISISRLAVAGFKAAKSRLRDYGVGRDNPSWRLRAEVCAGCPLVHIDRCGRQYCGRPFLKQIERDEPTEGCGCPIVAKAKDRSEHCPRNARFCAPQRGSADACDCQWCVAERAQSIPA